MFAITAKELRSLFVTPLAWVLLGIMQLILAWIFLIQLEGFMQVQPKLLGRADAPGLTDLIAAPLLETAATLLMLLTPLLTMRLISSELRSGTIDLLLSAPLSITRIVLGKYLTLLAFFFIAIVLTALMPLSLLIGANLDLGRLAAGLTGLFLLLALFGATGLFLSSMTRQPAVAATATYGLLLFLSILPQAGGEAVSPLFAWLSPSSHLRVLLSGLVQTSDLAYFLLLTAALLALAIRRLDSRRTAE